jgi:hypothetical protein
MEPRHSHASLTRTAHSTAFLPLSTDLRLVAARWQLD